MIALIIIVALGIDLTKQLATENAIYVWLTIIPAQFLALLLLYFFYEHCHVWKKGGVSVGYMYKESEENQENEVERPIEKQRFEGTWVSHSTKDVVAQVMENNDLESQETGGGMSALDPLLSGPTPPPSSITTSAPSHPDTN